jgi:hypothetical protein
VSCQTRRSFRQSIRRPWRRARICDAVSTSQEIAIPSNRHATHSAQLVGYSEASWTWRRYVIGSYELPAALTAVWPMQGSVLRQDWAYGGRPLSISR